MRVDTAVKAPGPAKAPKELSNLAVCGEFERFFFFSLIYGSFLSTLRIRGSFSNPGWVLCGSLYLLHCHMAVTWAFLLIVSLVMLCIWIGKGGAIPELLQCIPVPALPYPIRVLAKARTVNRLKSSRVVGDSRHPCFPTWLLQTCISSFLFLSFFLSQIRAPWW